MIAWMQKHNKYLVVTIWIATIAFIGAGFVGWGTYQYGSKSGAVAQVGEIPISQEKFNFTYQNLYRQIAQKMGGNFDDAKAKEMKLPQQALNGLIMQGYLLNLAKEYGVIVSDKELAEAIASLPSFQNNGRFDKKIYETFLSSRRISAKAFESILRDDLTIEKLMNLINKGAVPYERRVIASALGVSDKIRYTVLSPADVNVSVDEAAVKSYWKRHKDRYKTPKLYTLEILWTDTKSIHPDEQELKKFYEKNSFNYTDAEGKELGFEAAKAQVLKDYRIKKGKKAALLDYIAWKKGKKKPNVSQTLAEGNRTLSQELWQEIETHSPGTLLKPKAVGERYATVKIDKVIEPKVMDFAEASPMARKDWLAQAKVEALQKAARKALKNPADLSRESGYLSLTKNEALPPMNLGESLQFLQELFTSNNKNGIIDVNGKKVIYSIVDQKFEKSDDNLSRMIGRTADRIKKSEFEQSLLKELSERYPVRKFVKGI
jgi:peptidyl-prolyl cis-trans isomerase D